MRVLIAACLTVLATLSVVACNGDGEPTAPVESEPVRLWRASVWSPQLHSPEPALRAAERTLESPDVLPLDDVVVFAAVTIATGDLDRGTPALHVLRERQPQRPAVMLLQGLYHSVRHNRQDAKAFFDACILALANPDVDEPLIDEVRFLARLYRGQESYLLQDNSSAIVDLERARELRGAAQAEGVHRELVKFLADAHVHVQQYEPAEAILREALERDPDFPAHHFQLGAALAAQARTDEARDEFERCVELSPGDPRPRLKLAELARRDGNLESMRTHVDHLRQEHREGDLGGELSAAIGTYHLFHGRDLAAAGDDAAALVDYGLAREHLLRAIDGNPICTRAYTLIIQVAALLGAPEAEIDGYKQKLEELDYARSGFPAAADPQRTFC